MKKFILAAAVAFGLATAANAQQAAQPAAQAAPKNYVGAAASVVTNDGGQTVSTYGVRLGREFHRHIVGEVTFDHSLAASGNASGNAAFANGIAQYRIPGTAFTPYVLVGLGYGNDRWGDRALYNYGAGVKAEVSRTTDFDVRFRQVRNFDDWQSNGAGAYSNVATAGLNFKF